MAVYVLGPFFNLGTKMEPLLALASPAYGAFMAAVFHQIIESKGKAVLLEASRRRLWQPSLEADAV